jgi:hypothetical protein
MSPVPVIPQKVTVKQVVVLGLNLLGYWMSPVNVTPQKVTVIRVVVSRLDVCWHLMSYEFFWIWIGNELKYYGITRIQGGGSLF